jgi:hypothetical protein
MDYANQTYYTNIADFLGAFMKPGQEIYDFSDQPGVYYYILDYRPATLHYVVAEDDNVATQERPSPLSRRAARSSSSWPDTHWAV